MTISFQLKKFFLLLAVLAVFFLMNCSLGVPQWQREHLSDPIMQMDEDPEADMMEQHFLPYREGSGGGYGGAGGGCGC